MTPQDNAEIVRRAMAQVSAHGVEAAVRGLYAEDAVMYGIEGWPETGPWRGRAAILDEWRRIEEDFDQEGQQLLVEDIVAHGDWVVARSVWRVRSRSGLEGEIRSSLAARMRDGSVVEARFFWDHADALRIVGLDA